MVFEFQDSSLINGQNYICCKIFKYLFLTFLNPFHPYLPNLQIEIDIVFCNERKTNFL